MWKLTPLTSRAMPKLPLAAAATTTRSFQSKTFQDHVQTATMSDRTEQILAGGRHLFPLLPKAFAGVKQIGVVGWGSQAPAQAQNLRDSLKGTDIRVKVGLRSNSSSLPKARAAGFTEESNTLGDQNDVLAESDLVLLLISDAASVSSYKDIFARLKPGATLGLSHGYLLGHLDSVGESFPPSINVVMVAPKGMGPSVRRLYVQAAQNNGGTAGINASVAVHQDVNGRATDHALGWSVALGSPYSFPTTLGEEYKSDIYGERGVLLGGVYGLIEALFRHYVHQGKSPAEAFHDAADSLTGPLNTLISHHGLLAVYDAFEGADKEAFEAAYTSAYHPSREVLEEIYDEVASGNEIRSVNMAVDRQARGFPMLATLEHRWMWKLGDELRRSRDASKLKLHPTTAGMYVAMMMAQIDVLLSHNHGYSEIANESVIEATDSLNPFMHARGVAYMVDNCSMTARLGTRKWAPRFDYTLTEQALSVGGDSKTPLEKKELLAKFTSHRIHDVLNTCLKLRPDGKTIHYSAERIIGNGSFGVVFQATIEETNEVVAIKKVLQDKRFKNREMQIMRQLQHDNIVQLKHCFYCNGEKPDELYLNLVMEYIPDTLYGVARQLQRSKQLMPIVLVKLYIYQICRALGYTHSMGICHRDIKPQNLLLNPTTHVVKICDFGRYIECRVFPLHVSPSAKMLQKNEPNVSYICSRYYRAPELIFGATDYSTAIDVWSLGCVFGELLLGSPLFPGESGVDQLVEIIKVLGTPTRDQIEAMNPNYTEFQFPQIQAHPWSKVFRSRTPPEAIDLIAKMLEYDPIKRIKPLEAAAHPFFDELRQDPSINPLVLPQNVPPPVLFDFTWQ
ncbi:hypothetical protein DYB38_008440, partial [Aphanomyces astaci]